MPWSHFFVFPILSIFTFHNTHPCLFVQTLFIHHLHLVQRGPNWLPWRWNVSHPPSLPDAASRLVFPFPVHSLLLALTVSSTPPPAHIPLPAPTVCGSVGYRYRITDTYQCYPGTPSSTLSAKAGSCPNLPWWQLINGNRWLSSKGNAYFEIFFFTSVDSEELGKMTLQW